LSVLRKRKMNNKSVSNESKLSNKQHVKIIDKLIINILIINIKGKFQSKERKCVAVVVVVVVYAVA